MMPRKLYFLLFLMALLPFSNLLLLAGENNTDRAPESLQINIITYCNSVGLETDYNLMKDALEGLGHSVRSVYWHSNEEVPFADINIFFEHIVPDKFSWARLNWFVPNPEWFISGTHCLDSLDLILCRTHEVERIFQAMHKPTYYLGFTSPDCYESDIPKDYSQLLHLAGLSISKGTQTVIDLWERNSSLPLLSLVTRRPWSFSIENPENLNVYGFWLSENDLRRFQNNCGIHLCPSETEGFGHYIMEAMSVGAVIVTTDAPPMNEFITDPRCLVPYHHSGIMRLAQTYYVDQDLLEAQIQCLAQLPLEELEEIGKNNRLRYLKLKEQFLERLENLILQYTQTISETRA